MSDQTRGHEEWREALPALADTLRRFGYDIEPPQPGGSAPRDLVARRDVGDRAVLVAIDGAGRFRVEITWVVGEWPRRTEIARVPVRMVETVTRATTIAGEAASPEEMTAVLAALGTVVAWAAPVADGPGPRGESE
jgi:hypothetical protein